MIKLTGTEKYQDGGEITDEEKQEFILFLQEEKGLDTEEALRSIPEEDLPLLFKEFRIKKQKTKSNVTFKEGGSLVQLDDKGNTETILEGGERIFSIQHTELLVKKSLSANTDEDLINLGKDLVKILHKQDTQKQEYVKN